MQIRPSRPSHEMEHGEGDREQHIPEPRRTAPAQPNAETGQHECDDRPERDAHLGAEQLAGDRPLEEGADAEEDRDGGDGDRAVAADDALEVQGFGAGTR